MFCRLSSRAIVAPQEGAVFRLDADDPAVEELNILFLAAHVGDHHGGILGTITIGNLRLPDGVAGLLVEGNQRGLFAARRADKPVAVDQS